MKCCSSWLWLHFTVSAGACGSCIEIQNVKEEHKRDCSTNNFVNVSRFGCDDQKCMSGADGRLKLWAQLHPFIESLQEMLLTCVRMCSVAFPHRHQFTVEISPETERAPPTFISDSYPRDSHQRLYGGPCGAEVQPLTCLTAYISLWPRWWCFSHCLYKRNQEWTEAPTWEGWGGGGG